MAQRSKRINMVNLWHWVAWGVLALSLALMLGCIYMYSGNGNDKLLYGGFVILITGALLFHGIMHIAQRSVRRRFTDLNRPRRR